MLADDDDGTDAMVRFTLLLGLRLSTEADISPAFDGTCFKNGNESELIPGKTTVLGSLCTVCFHTDCCSVLMEYVLDKIILELVATDSVGSVHDPYTPLKDEL